MSTHSKNASGKGAKLVYLIIVLILAVVILYLLNWLWRFAGRYQAGSIDTLLQKAAEEISAQTGEEITYSSVPTVESSGESSFDLRSGKQNIGKVVLGIKEMGPFSQAIYEIRSIRGIAAFDYEASEGIELINTVTGEPLTTAGSTVFPGTESFINYQGNKVSPRVYSYSADGLYSKTQIEAKCPGSKLLFLENDNGIVTIYKTPEDAALSSSLKSRAFQIAQAYSGYISTDVTWWTLSSMIMNGSPLLESIPSMDVQWYTTHNAIRYENVMCSEPLILSGNYALVQITYDFIVSSNWTKYAPGSDVTYPIQLTQYLHLDDDGIWRLADLNMILRLDLEMTPYTE